MGNRPFPHEHREGEHMPSFTIQWSPQGLGDLRRTLDTYRRPAIAEGTGWQYGADPDTLDRLVERWRSDPQGDSLLTTLQRFPHERARIGDTDIHFVHVSGEAGGHRPLLLLHGWPGSVYEFWRVIEPLAFPSRHGGDPADAFDVVVPSLPGFGFSSFPAGTVGPRRTAALFDQLMREVLGYPHYLAHGGDWGAGVAAWIALDHPASVPAIHLSYLLTRSDQQPETDSEREWFARYQQTQEQFGAYSNLQRTRPVSLAWATLGNPIGQLAWIVERFHDWADLSVRRFEDVFTDEDLLVNAALYTHTGAFETSVQYYARAEVERARWMPERRRVEVPTAFRGYPSPAFPVPPREWVGRAYNLSSFTTMPAGGHFPALEVPTSFVNDLRCWGRGE